MFSASHICWVSSGTVRRGTANQGLETHHEEVQAGDGDQVDGQLAQSAVLLSSYAEQAENAPCREGWVQEFAEVHIRSHQSKHMTARLH
eukprot:1158733-Pelagomonas_calceolata.AAC.5